MKQNASLLKKIELPRTPAEWLEAVMNFLFFLCGILAVGCVVLISVYMIASGVPAIRKIGLFRFLFGTEWASTAADPKYGILPFILSSIYGTLGAAIIGVPIGLLTAVFLSKAADPKLRTVVVTAIELLSGIPSVVFGLLGDLIMKSGNYASVKKTILGYDVFSLWMIGTYIPMYFMVEQSRADFAAGFGEEYADKVMSVMPMWSIVLVIAGIFLCALLGGLIGKALLKKHFAKAGIA